MYYTHYSDHFKDAPNTFDEVVALYESITPIRGALQEAGRDIRPLGKRDRKWHRIMKLDENAYALLSGIEYYSWAGHAAQSKLPTDYMERIRAEAAILWRKVDGKELIHVRRPKWTMSGSAKTHLQYFLPKGLVLHEKAARYFVNDAYLLKRGDGAVFRRKGDTWVGLDNSTDPGPATRINTRVKTPERAALQKEFLDWAMVMTPMLVKQEFSAADVMPNTGGYRSPYTAQQHHWAALRMAFENASGQEFVVSSKNTSHIAKMCRRIIADKEHNARSQLAALVLMEAAEYEYRSGGEPGFARLEMVSGPKQLRNKANNVLNLWCGYLNGANQ
jgi:hypothetical protein